MSIINKLQELGYELPVAPKPVASYVSAVCVNDLLFTSGVLPVLNGKLVYDREVGGFLNSVDYGYKAAQLCALNALSVINDYVGLDNVIKIVKLTGYVNSVSAFTDQPKVINGASDLLVEVFGEAGKHARTAVDVNELPLGASVELDLIVQFKS